MKLATLEAVRAAMLTKVEGSLLTAADAQKLKLKPMTAEQVKALDVPATVPGFMIPYFNIDGKPSKFWRLRYLEDTRKGFDILNGRKALRYVQPAGGINEVYLPPFVDWRRMAENTNIPLTITEGELKAAAASKHGIPTIGLGGVWCFKSNRAVVSLLPMLKEITWKGRRVVICYDSDAVTNPEVVKAENALAAELTLNGAEVFIARLPMGPQGAKVGIDDFLLTASVDEFAALLLQASSFAACHALHAMNELVVYIKNPGLVFEHKGRQRMRSSDFTSHAYAHYWHDEAQGEKVIKKQTAMAWLQWPHRTQLEAVTFAPGQPPITENKLNIWDGWPLDPKKGSVAMWAKLLDHLFEDTDPAARKWFEQWCAFPMQNPGYKMASSAVFWGVETGTGKTLAGNTLMRIYGKYSTEITDLEIEDERFEWAENMQFVLADDITGSSNRRLANRLKTMITQKTLKLNIKFVPRYSVPDCINYYFTSNDPDAFYMDDKDRRHFIHEVLASKVTEAFRNEYAAWMHSDEGIRALFYYFLHLDLTGFDPHGEAFQTAAKRDMISVTKSDISSWVLDLRVNEARTLKLKGDLFTSAELLAMYDPMGNAKVSANGMARELKRAGFRAPGTGSMAATKFGNVRLYAIKNPEFWKKQKHKAIVDHYESNRSMEPTIKKEGKVKF